MPDKKLEELIGALPYERGLNPEEKALRDDFRPFLTLGLHERRAFRMSAKKNVRAMHLQRAVAGLTRSYNWMVRVVGLFAILLGTQFDTGEAQAAVAAANPVEIYVQHNIDIGYAILNDPTLSDDERRLRFRSFTLSLTDPRRIGLFTLGQYAGGASMSDIESFLVSFTDYIVALYETRLTKYKNRAIRVDGSVQRASDDVVVSAEISANAPSAQPIKAAFRVRKTADGRPIVTDIQVEGVWLALSKRAEFMGFLQQHNGNIPALSQNLITQTAELHNRN